MPVTVRRATIDDVDVLAAIWRDGWRDAHLGRVPAELEHERLSGSWRDEVTVRLAGTWVAEVGGVVVGFVTIVGDELEDIYVAAGSRGTGVATTLLRHGERVVRDAGFSSVWLAVVAGNERARRFYERHGWRDEGSFRHHARLHGGTIAVPARRYRRNLGRAASSEGDTVDTADTVIELPRTIVERVRHICCQHAGVIEEAAWTGLRWRTGTTAVAHLVLIDDGWPPAYARAAGTSGPLCVLTVRADRADVDALTRNTAAYFAPAWGTQWTPSVLGIRLDDSTDWNEVAEHVGLSYQLATSRLRRRARHRTRDQ